MLKIRHTSCLLQNVNAIPPPPPPPTYTRTHCASATERVRHSTFSGVGLSLNNIIQTGIVSTFPLRFPTERLHRMKHRKWRETKQQPSTAGPGNMLGCCLVPFHFLWAILWPHTVKKEAILCSFKPHRLFSDFSVAPLVLIGRFLNNGRGQVRGEDITVGKETTHAPCMGLESKIPEVGEQELNRWEWKRLKGCVFLPPSVRPEPSRGREARKRNPSIPSIPTPVFSSVGRVCQFVTLSPNLSKLFTSLSLRESRGMRRGGQRAGKRRATPKAAL